MKTSTQIIEGIVGKECQVRWTERVSFHVVCGHPFPCPEHTSVKDIKAAIFQAMKTAVEEVTPDKEKCDHSEWQECGCLDYNDAIDDMEEKKRKFFEE